VIFNMTIGAFYIHIGFLDEFKSEPTVLILGDAQGFSWLAGIIESRWTGSFSLFPCVQLANMNLYLSYSDKSGQLERSGPNFHWKLSNIEAIAFPEQLIELADSEHPCHAYLDAPVPREGIQVVASLNEYDPKLLFPD
jgi:hypothetical protein